MERREARGGTLILGGGFAGSYVARLLKRHGATIVSLENFLNMTGLRRARGADRVEFHPGLPYAGQGLQNAFTPAQKNGDDKGGEPKEKEKEKEK